MKQMRNLLMAHRHVPSRQEPLSRPRNIPGYQEWKNSATPRAWRSCGVTGSASVSRSPKASALQFRGSKQRTGRLLPALAIQGTARHGKHMYPPSSRQPPVPPAGRCFARERLQPFQTQPASRSIDRLLAPVPVCHLSSPIDPPVLHASPFSGQGAPHFVPKRASDRFKETAA